jgi:hypothetical protein
MPLIRSRSRLLLLFLALAASACTPTLDWREVNVADTPLRLMLPCRAQQQERTIVLAGQSVRWRLLVCSAGSHTFGVGWGDLGNPLVVGPALAELLVASGTHVSASTDAAKPLLVPGATPHAGSQQVLLLGRRADGQPAQMELALFTFGTTVFQVTVLGPSVTSEQATPLMDSLRIQP